MSELVFSLEKQASRLEDVTRPSTEHMKALADPQPKDEFSVKETQLTRFTHIAMRPGGTPPRGRMGDSVTETLHAFKNLTVEHIQLPTLRIDTPLPRDSTPLSVSDDRASPSPVPDNFNMSIDDVKKELAKIPYNFNKRRRSSIQPVHIDHPYNWHKDAIVYEVYVRGFFDSNNDGIGDIPGLTQKLDYLQWLGINCLWLLPVFKSPLRDGGYDIADYYDILPEYGTIDNFRVFLNEAHRREIRVICDLVVNHTSDEHPWFKEACRSKDDPKRDWYVWSDTNEKYKDARVIFVDTNKSNWTWHEPTKQFYWHRFFSHQPDLNYENPEVQEVMLDVMDYWFEFGVDGFRIDAAPYLFEEDGTNCENLPQTHAYIKKMRAHVDKHYPGRLLLAEANQWPSDVIQYMGAGDECHMAYHFPIMPRIFIALRQKDRTPVVEILKNTPVIPANCQWGLFLRNHDELTLEMCTNEERDYLYNEYCKEARMRCNIGIRRRLAPLVENDRREVELLIALLFGLPGTPFLYYGDEIGMGDNIYLGDRDGVRTPMQWSSDRNGGFSRCDFAQLYFASNMDPVFGYISVNVEAQQRHSSSLLNWMRNMIIHRKKYTIFGRGTLEFLYPTNHKVLAFLRSDKEDVVMCLYNLSSTSQPVELDLSRFIGANPVEMIDGVVFPEVKDNQYQLSLGPLGWMWFHLKTKKRGMPNHGLVMGTKEDRPNSPDI